MEQHRFIRNCCGKLFIGEAAIKAKTAARTKGGNDGLDLY
jgi:hypothetical protein